MTALTALIDRSLAPLALVQREPPLRHGNAAFLALTGPEPWAALESGLTRLFQEGNLVDIRIDRDSLPPLLLSLWPLHGAAGTAPAGALVVAVGAAPTGTAAPVPLKAVHDLRGALNNIGLSVELLLRAPLAPADRTARLRELRELVEGAGQLLDRLPAAPRASH